jgi:hypothetical protein
LSKVSAKEQRGDLALGCRRHVRGGVGAERHARPQLACWPLTPCP